MSEEFFGPAPVARSLAQVFARNEQYRENRARQAYSYLRVSTTGSGEFQLAEVAPFSAVFARQPDISYGYAVEDLLVKTRFPRAHGGVYRWQRDARGFYVGAYVFLVVDTSGPDTDAGASLYEDPPSYTLRHSFTFSGLAVKSVPEALFDPA